ncbi:MAG: ROK family protein [Lentisphaeria bacterium]
MIQIPAPKFVPPLEAHFSPACLYNRTYKNAVRNASGNEKTNLLIAVERESGLIGRYDIEILTSPENSEQTLLYVERHLKFVLWSQGGWRITVHGPAEIGRALHKSYSTEGQRAFDDSIMAKVYGRHLIVRIVNSADEVPSQHAQPKSIGGHLDGCRIGFDLGASDYKLAAVQDGKPVFSTEIPWDPVPQTDPEYHYQRIREGLEMAAAELPRVDAIGGSAAGIYIDNEVKVASLFRGIPANRFKHDVKNLFKRLADEWRVPLVVVNDGDVTALAGAMSLKTNNLLGIAMGSSEAVGYVDAGARITGALNELAFAPVDFNPDAAADEWSGDRGVGALYFSQQAVNRLLPAAGIQLADDMPLPEKLKEVQALAENNDDRARSIFESIGVYLGYSLVHYHDYYKYENALLLGRVTSGAGGEIILAKARETLKGAFPDLAAQTALKVPDEKSRRVGQAVAAASLPEIS